MEGILTKLQRSRLSIGVDLMRCTAVFVLLLMWKEAASVPLRQGPSEQPAASPEQPGVNQSRGWPGLVTVNSRTPRRWLVRVAVREPDYDGSEEEEEEPTMPPHPLHPLKQCNYDRCTHMQVPCAELQKEKPCLCPGMASQSIAPEQPRVEPVTGITDHEATVHWCEPLSMVKSYQLVYWAEGSPGNTTISPRLPSPYRVHTLDGLLAGTGYVVCVQAINPSGASTLQGNGNCVTFSTTSVRRLILYLGISVCTLVLLSVACVSLKCYCARRRSLDSSSPTPPSPSSMPLGLRNPTYEQDKSSSPPS
ncbi:leucine-rich repeat neuronal protein 4-like [Leucoraja erinacea]|uniref:leucine-rich repeat neuronal protein 4-like n=1 Tax=Leucoraja erinaceus TaxID=7782 RepID=UPI0024554A33|nr:leucine-rich repeat neuronal protein 4-like [Leucoraja erinacea]